MTAMGEYIGHNYICHNYKGHNHIGHNYIGHNYIGHNNVGHNYVGHNYLRQVVRDSVGESAHRARAAVYPGTHPGLIQPQLHQPIRLR